MTKFKKMKLQGLLITLSVLILNSCSTGSNVPLTIVMDPGAQVKVVLAGKELQRYLYLLTDTLPDIGGIGDEYSEDETTIYVGSKDQEFIIEQAKSLMIFKEIAYANVAQW